MASGHGGAGRPGALIVGASSGIGAALAKRLVADGYRVALVARRQDELYAACQRLNEGSAGESVALAYAHDVRDYDYAPQLFPRIAADVAPLRLVVYAAGVMSRDTTGASFADERGMIETNVIGAMRWLGLAADHLANQRAGTIVGISSVAGDRGRPGNGAYMASKAALSTYLDALRFRLKPRGVRVVTVKAGYVATPMTVGLRLPRPLTVSADGAASRIAQAAARGRAIAYVPGYWSPIMWVVRHLPAAVVARLPG